MRKFFAIAVLCLIAAPVFAGPKESFRDIGSRIRERIFKIIRVPRVIVPTDDTLQPPRP